jgi:DNA helicase II / ATP-dependent DNA helicase PcrA
MDFQTELTKLNPQQREAVETTQGPVLVIAGPGTGKTQVLAMRIANILQTTDTKASSILCLTFTESGVAAMRKRLMSIIGNEAYYVRIHTFHSFCNEIIQSFPDKFAFARELIQLDDLGRIKIIRGILDELDSTRDLSLRPFFNRYQYQSEIINSIQTLKREGVNADNFVKIAKENLAEQENNPTINKKTGKPTGESLTKLKSAQRNVELAEIYDLYNQKMQEAGLYDYEDMILFVITRMQTDSELLANYQERYLYILVDEYQDTNGAQNEIIRLLGSFDPSPNIFAVGDDDQAIYRFQGANVDNLLFFTNQFKNVKTIPITTSYRSSQNVLDLSVSLIRHNKNRLVNLIDGLRKDLKAGREIPNYPAEVYELDNRDQENKFVVEKIKELVEAGASYDDIAILYRRHSDAEDIAEALLRAEIPMQLAAGRNALDEVVVHKFVNLLKVIQFRDRNRDRLLFEVLFYDFLKFDRLDVFKVTRMAADRQLSLFDVISDPELLVTAGVEDAKKFTEFAEQIVLWQEEAANSLLIQFVEQVGVKSGFTPFIFDGGEVNIEDINSINSFFNHIKQVNRQNRHMRLIDLLADINLLEENKMSISEQELSTNAEGVNMMTAHKSKGLEFKYIFVVKFYDGNWGGHTRRNIIKLPEEIFVKTEVEQAAVEKESSEALELEDERRLLFVALTRAKERIYLSYAKEYASGETTKTTVPSQFLSELEHDLLQFPSTVKFAELSARDMQSRMSPIPMPDYNDRERDYLLSLVKDFRLSATAFNTYIECPLRFKFDCLLKVPLPRDKTQAMGTAVHFALEHFYRQLKAGELKDKDYLLFVFEQAVKRELLNPEEALETISEGNKILTDYYENYKGTFTAPAEVECGFYGHDIVLELKGMEPQQLSGKLDRVDWLDKEHFKVKVVDYKTMSPKSANDIKGLTKNGNAGIWRQLVFYKLLGDLDRRFRPGPNLPKYNIETAEIDFLKPNSSGYYKRESFEITQQDVEELVLKIEDVVKKIRDLEFKGSDEYPICGECMYCKLFA